METKAFEISANIERRRKKGGPPAQRDEHGLGEDLYILDSRKIITTALEVASRFITRSEGKQRPKGKLSGHRRIKENL